MTETRDIKLSSDRWTEAGSGPMLIGAHGDHVLFAVSDAAPCGRPPTSDFCSVSMRRRRS